MSEVIIMKSIDALFWLLLLFVVLWMFRNEIKQLLQSLTSLKVAGATFELKNNKETLRSYILLAETLIDFLSKGNRIEELKSFMDSVQIEKLGNFALQYTKEIPHENWNEQLLRNIAILLFRFGRSRQSVDLYDALLRNRPNDVDLLNLKAVALMTTRITNNVKTAEDILVNLIDRYPEQQFIRFNLALALSLLQKGNEAVTQMWRAIDDGYWKDNADCLYDPLFHYVRENLSKQFEQLKLHLHEVMRDSVNSQNKI